MSTIMNLLREEEKRMQRLSSTETLLSQLRPWLDYRRVTQNKIENCPANAQASKDILNKLIEYCDNEIKNLLGL